MRTAIQARTEQPQSADCANEEPGNERCQGGAHGLNTDERGGLYQLLLLVHDSERQVGNSEYDCGELYRLLIE